MKKFVLLLALVCAQSHADQVVGVADGDTLTVLRDGRQVKVRLANIDAPEKKQAYGTRSKQALSLLCFGRNAVLDVGETDRYGRMVAVVHCGGVNANAAQVRNGMAWVYRQYNHDIGLLGIEAAARAARTGLWADQNPQEPWLYRKSRKTQGASLSRAAAAN